MGKRISVYIPSSLIAKLEIVMKLSGKNLTQVVREALEKYVDSFLEQLGEPKKE